MHSISFYRRFLCFTRCTQETPVSGMNNTATAAAVEAKSGPVVCMAPKFLVALLSCLREQRSKGWEA